MKEDDQQSPWYEVIFKDYFGINWTAFATLSGVLLSGLGLAGLLNPATWTVGALTGLLIGYSLRSYVSHNYLGTMVVSVVFWIAACVGAFYPLRSVDGVMVSYASLYWEPNGVSAALATLVVALVIAMNIAILVIAYKKRNVFSAGEIPEDFRNHIVTMFEGGNIYRKDMRYELDFKPGPESGDGVVVAVNITYELVNRGNVTIPETITYVGSRGRVQINRFAIGEVDYAAEVKNQLDREKIELQRDVLPDTPLKVDLQLVERYDAEGNDFFTSYLPCNGFTVAIKAAGDITVWVETLSPAQFDSETEGETRIWKRQGALLPYHGLRLFWKKETIDATRKVG